MANFFTDNPDIKFQYEKKIDFKRFFSLLIEEEKEYCSAKTSEEYAQSLLSVLEQLGEILGDVAENASQVDREGTKLENGKEKRSPALAKNIALLKEFGIPPTGIGPEFGGFGLPFFLEMTGGEMCNRACPSTALVLNWYGCIARILEKYASEDIQKDYIPQIAQGISSGNMALTEPDAGSDLGALKTYAEEQPDGSWKLYGTKRFISNGTSELSLVLAKTKKGAEGLNNLSLYLCPRVHEGKENIKVLKLEEKLGLHGSATAELAYDGSYALLIGKANRGFPMMLDLMNESRIGVAVQAVGLMEATWRLAKNYAEQRSTWGKPIAQHELIADKLLDMETELKVARSLCYETAYLHSLEWVIGRRLKDKKLSKPSVKELEKELQTVNKQVRKRTPLIKFWLAEKAIEHARLCMQIHGGYGYITEYKAEWWLRESFILTVYEGTSQIQALMCTKDLFKEIIKNPKLILDRTLQFNWKPFQEKDPLMRKFWKLKKIGWMSTLSVLLKVVRANIKIIPSFPKTLNPLALTNLLRQYKLQFDDLRPALIHAERLTEIKALEALANSAIEDYKADKGRAWIADRFLNKAILRSRYLQSLIGEDDEVLQGYLDSFETAASQEKEERLASVQG
ncbi:MAG: acyl-CoA dehydrogenase family protein [Deltaproteobacteria bacterium]|nr:acyl-CoA dehydrogenase family protein [Deltaproteobacteria bacterium]